MFWGTEGDVTDHSKRVDPRVSPDFILLAHTRTSQALSVHVHIITTIITVVKYPAQPPDTCQNLGAAANYRIVAQCLETEPASSQVSKNRFLSWCSNVMNTSGASTVGSATPVGRKYDSGRKKV